MKQSVKLTLKSKVGIKKNHFNTFVELQQSRLFSQVSVISNSAIGMVESRCVQTALMFFIENFRHYI
jgi:hypothetical protein